MPNKRHPARHYIGFWGTHALKEKLQKLASKQGVTLTVLILKILWDHINKLEVLLVLLLQP